jgi:hypothetical protein
VVVLEEQHGADVAGGAHDRGFTPAEFIVQAPIPPARTLSR